MLIFFKNWLHVRKAEKQSAQALYQACCAAARQAVFYKTAGSESVPDSSVPDSSVPDSSVPDSVQGRFEMIVVHLWLVQRHLRRLEAFSLAKRLSAIFFSDMDASMRESGVGDMAVPHRMRTIAQAFYGRLEAYDRAINEGTLKAAIIRNIAPAMSSSRAAALSAYLVASDELLAKKPLSYFYAASALFAKKLPYS